MIKVAIFLLFLLEIVASQQPIILVMKTSPLPGLESETDALPVITASKISKFQSYRIILWEEIENKLGRDRMAEILRCQDSSCIVKFTELLKTYKLCPNYMIFCSISKYDPDYTVTLKIADANKGHTFGLVSTSISNLESFHTSGGIENIIRKIPSYAAKSSLQAQTVATFPGVNALGNDTSYFVKLINDATELKPYINCFQFHDERKKILVNTLKPIDTLRFPTVALYRPDLNDSLYRTSMNILSFYDSIAKSKTLHHVTIDFKKDRFNHINKIVFKSEVPSQARYGNDYSDLKKDVLDKITKANFVISKADSSSGLYGVNFTYQYTVKQNSSIVGLKFTADASIFTIVVEKFE